jgi:hypothetical protein
MKTTLLKLFALTATLFSAGAASAQIPGGTRSDDAQWAAVKHLEFTADDIEGGLMGPEGEPIIVVSRAEHESLIELRANFEAEIVKSLEDM